MLLVFYFKKNKLNKLIKKFNLYLQYYYILNVKIKYSKKNYVKYKWLKGNLVMTKYLFFYTKSFELK